ncbi:MAG: hypothetical protein A3J30_00550 [Candidatus Wildermuthbacteria bacterium RIFCSPLOWO2_02_FULL_47_9c]|uniref:Fibronectin type-III domain-containing protein n=2 Tax=Parcubacteria group TaxID=1794811 RepID=A0A837IMC2_9BACT|nr:MAG: hypothetical protein UY25_C0004G0015 [Candidatus Yanofskybacteria bacterium GW2011_GWC1_48_11]KKW04549.1 MAG: hypothetical protein UY38_C0001G0116 [Parcubacteria group bacterium GW2011_GWB1_49_12]KKW09193.1 MAG: hypothetical protein UY45_C0001G0079 [Parcubacteria group bacterium GW2011_GWA1_49_26]KKW14170.1 MAG: hypothetical protein UY53_C0003G0090 [Parcubacteria group bacterium GW2011_GWA2_50_10]OHA61444.1 MAG: hypothetical protein A2109_01020 [Candidatus Wildermuthbacteria bacterium G
MDKRFYQIPKLPLKKALLFAVAASPLLAFFLWDRMISLAQPSGEIIREAQVAASSDDAYHDPDSWPEYSHTDSDFGVFAGNPGSSGEATFGGWRWTGLGIPAGALISKAYVEFNQQEWGYLISTSLAFEDTASPSSFSPNSTPFHRWGDKTNFVINWTWPKQIPDSWIQTPSLTAGIQELVDKHGSIEEVVLLESGATVEPEQYHSWTSYDLNPSLAAKLHITYTTSAPGSDTTPPNRYDGEPLGLLPSGTTQADVSLTTSKDAICKYDTIPGTSYAVMPNVFANTNATKHSFTLSNLGNGLSYNFYVRCQDNAGNSNPDDYVISFQTLPECSPPNTGDWEVTQSCILNTTVTPPTHVIVKDSANLIIQKVGVLNINLSNLIIEKGGEVIVEEGGSIF